MSSHVAGNSWVHLWHISLSVLFVSTPAGNAVRLLLTGSKEKKKVNNNHQTHEKENDMHSWDNDHDQYKIDTLLVLQHSGFYSIFHFPVVESSINFDSVLKSTLIQMMTTTAAVTLAFEEMHNTVCKWMRNLRTKIRKSGTFQKHLYHHQTIQWNTETLFTSDAHFPFTILVGLLWLFASRVVWDVLRLNPVCWIPACVYAVRITSMILHTAEICINATPVLYKTVSTP